jgi:hypothetical protein
MKQQSARFSKGISQRTLDPNARNSPTANNARQERRCAAGFSEYTVLPWKFPIFPR